jgi:voltage-gated potassium channel
MTTETPHTPFRDRLHTIVFESETRAGRAFDIALFLLILASVGAVMLDSVAEIHAAYGAWLYRAELAFTAVFTIEYLLRLSCVLRPLAYARSFFGLIDLLAILPGYLSLLFPGTEYLLIIRLLRMLRIFRVLKLMEYFRESQVIISALRASRNKISVFIFAVVQITVVTGGLMYVIEGPENGFTSIPVSVYWAIVTITTVGYGDIAPKTPLGQFVASCVMILGYAIIAVPTGIVTAQMVHANRPQIANQSCPSCSAEGHDPDAKHCKLCGAKL